MLLYTMFLTIFRIQFTVRL